MQRRSRARANRPAPKPAPAPALAMFESLESRQLLSTYLVTTTSNSGSGSLRDAITRANTHSGADLIQFRIGSGAKTISPTSALPTLTGPTVVDATTQSGYAGKPLIELNGANAGSSSNGLKLAGGTSTVKGLVINRFGGCGILVLTHGGDKIVGNYIGTDRSGAAALGNKSHGIMLWSSGNTVGGTTAAERNVISGNASAGVFCYTSAASNNKISGNYIGTNASGSGAIANLIGVQLNGAAYNTVGGTTAGSRNVISGNKRDGVLMVTSGANHNTATGNYIGINAAGTGRLGNGWYGIEISQPDNLVGGTTAAARNVISANGISGVVMYLSTGTRNRVQGNYIGTDYTGTRDLGNTTAGVEITNSASHNTVGGDSKAAGNVIAGNNTYGVGIYNSANYNTVRYNRIGLSATGLALPKSKHGVLVATSSNNLICDNTFACCSTYKGTWISSGSGNTCTRNVTYLNVATGARLI
jgi:hypothetical protein